jgi:hypothetical protein
VRSTIQEDDEAVAVAAGGRPKLPEAGAGDGGFGRASLVAEPALNEGEAPSRLAQECLRAVAPSGR